MFLEFLELMVIGVTIVVLSHLGSHLLNSLVGIVTVGEYREIPVAAGIVVVMHYLMSTAYAFIGSLN